MHMVPYWVIFSSNVGPQIVETYHTFLDAEFNSKAQIFLLQNFLSWQYDSYVSQQTPQ